MAQKITPTRRRLMSVADAARLADVNPRTVRRWIAAGVLPGYRVGPRLLKVDVADLDRIARPISPEGDSAA